MWKIALRGTAITTDPSADLVPRPNGALVGYEQELIDAWLRFEDMNGAAPATIRTYRRSIEVFTTWAAAQGLQNRPCRPSDILAFKGFLAKRYSPATTNLRLTAVRCFYRWAVVHDRLPYNPASEIQGVKEPHSHRHKRDALSAAEVRAVLETCDLATPVGIRDRALLTLLAYCALRVVEVHRANLGHLTTQAERMVLQVQGKGRLEADEIVVVPTSQEVHLRAWITQRLKIRPCGPTDPLFISLSRRSRGSRLAPRSIRGIVKGRFAEAGVYGSRKSTHSLRHTAITAAIRAGADPMQVRAMARHESLDTTLIYVHETGRVDDPAEDLIDYE